MNGNGKNIVLDIDATLVHTHGDMDDFKMLNVYGNEEQLDMRKKVYNMRIIDVSDVPGEGEVTDLAGIYRPYLREFLEFGFSYFDNIVIWSAGKKKYVEKMCEYMFPLKKQPILIFNYDDCEGDENNLIIKPLDKIYNHPECKGKLFPENTFVLDDRSETYSMNKRNGIQIPEFESDMSVEDICNHPDVEFLKLMSWMSTKEVRESDDVRKLNKKNIFSRNLKEYREVLRDELQTKKMGEKEEEKTEEKAVERPKTGRGKKKVEEKVEERPKNAKSKKNVEEKTEERPKTARSKKETEKRPKTAKSKKEEEKPKTARSKKKTEERPKTAKSKKDEKPTTKKKRSVKFKK
tara:strand:- start:686 stop:1732 length:1047 start_codon:yes stop_codon:yes gene_type:complete